MKLLINGETVQFSLEKEKTVNDVINNIREWAAQSANLIEKIEIDGKAWYDTEEKQFADLLLDRIKVIAFSILPQKELAVKTLLEQIAWITKLELYFKNMEQEDTQDKANKDFAEQCRRLLEGAAWLKTGSESILNLFGFDEDLKNMQGSLKELELLLFSLQTKPLSEELSQKGVLLCSEISSSLGEHYKRAVVSVAADELNLYTKESDLRSTQIPKTMLAILDNISSLLETAAENIQIGSDAQAMSQIKVITESFGVIIKAIDLLSHKTDLHDSKEMIKELTAVLKEIAESFEAHDFVYLSDLLEYDLAEEIETIKNWFAALSSSPLPKPE